MKIAPHRTDAWFGEVLSIGQTFSTTSEFNSSETSLGEESCHLRIVRHAETRVKVADGLNIGICNMSVGGLDRNRLELVAIFIQWLAKSRINLGTKVRWRTPAIENERTT
jgi:hypothetical protein